MSQRRTRPGTATTQGDSALRTHLRQPNVARMYDYLLLRHEAPLYRAGVRDPRRWAVAAA